MIIACLCGGVLEVAAGILVAGAVATALGGKTQKKGDKKDGI